MPAKLLTLIENQPSTEAFFARLGQDSTWSDDVIEQNITKALRGEQAAKSLIIFFKGGMARAQSIRKSRPTEKALLLGCDESKLECLHVN